MVKTALTNKSISKYSNVPRLILSLIGLFTLVYLSWWFNANNIGNPVLFGLLLIGEIYHVFQALGYVYTIWGQKPPSFVPVKHAPEVDVFITVCGEPVEVVEKTLKAAVSMDYPNFNVYILNDGYVARKDNWMDIDILAFNNGAVSITRTTPGGAKAGNVNNALSQTSAPLFVVFDADHVPEPDFLQQTVGYFEENEKMALVQTPQFYANKDANFLARSSWEQQELFFGPICRGKNRMNATFWCGTNAVIRRKALMEIGGVPENNIAEDFLASMLLHEKGWESVYVSKILARGLATTSLQEYVKQQYRWARGSLEVIFKYNPIFRKGLTWAQKFQYLYSSGYYLNGIIFLIDALIPILVLFTGISPVNAQSTTFLFYFVPFIFGILYLLSLSTSYTATFKAMKFSVGSAFVFIRALFSTLRGKDAKFEVTDKNASEGNYLNLVIPHFIYIILGISASVYGLVTQGFVPSVITNISWIIFNIAFLTPFIRVSYKWGLITVFIRSLLSSIRYRISYILHIPSSIPVLQGGNNEN